MMHGVRLPRYGIASSMVQIASHTRLLSRAPVSTRTAFHSMPHFNGHGGVCVLRFILEVLQGVDACGLEVGRLGQGD